LNLHQSVEFNYRFQMEICIKIFMNDVTIINLI